MPTKKEEKFILLYLAWLVAITATLGSLYFSEIEKFTPCVLCWYQRVLMYPLVLILLVGLIKKDRKVADYGLALAIPGWLLALYHNISIWMAGGTGFKPLICSLGVSCQETYINWFGFITIPLLSFAAFTVIILSLAVLRKSK